jgi:bacteriocin-like protein
MPPRDQQTAASQSKESAMNANTKTSGTIETRELTDDELSTVSGGIIVVCGQHALVREDALNPQPLPPVRGELLPAVQISM